MSQKSCFLVALAITLLLACGLPALGGKPPAKPPVLSYQILQLDLVDQDNVTYRATPHPASVTGTLARARAESWEP